MSELRSGADTYEPKPGDLVYFKWGGYSGVTDGADHVGIVAYAKIENNILETIEGNYTDGGGSIVKTGIDRSNKMGKYVVGFGEI